MSVQDLAKVHQMLADDESKDIYLNRLNYLITGNLEYIKEIVRTYLPDVGPGKARNLDDLITVLPKDRNFVLFGAGKFGQSLLCFVEHDKRFAGFCSSTKRRQQTGCAGYPVMSPEELLSRKDLSVIVAACGAPRLEIMRILKDGEYPAQMIFDGRVLGEKAVYDPDQYFNPSFLEFGNNEVFVDVGCLNLGSSLKMKAHCKQLKKVYAFEPDQESYAHCLERKKETNFNEAVILPYGAWSEETTLSFQGGCQGSSGVCDGGSETYKINVVPIDSVLDSDDKVTFIKMDIEGSELEALKGAKGTILRDKPKLAICIYHKPEDMTEIPLYIKGLVPEYKLYVRHHSSGPDETVLYAIP